MNTITATEFRKNLFKELSAVLHGFPLRIKTKEGNVLLVPEKKSTVSLKAGKPLASKIPGKLVNDLKDADEALYQHLHLPEIEE